MAARIKVKLTRDTFVRGESIKSGTVIEVDRETAAQLRSRSELIEERDPAPEHRDPKNPRAR